MDNSRVAQTAAFIVLFLAAIAHLLLDLRKGWLKAKHRVRNGPADELYDDYATNSSWREPVMMLEILAYAAIAVYHPLVWSKAATQLAWCLMRGFEWRAFKAGRSRAVFASSLLPALLTSAGHVASLISLTSLLVGRD